MHRLLGLLAFLFAVNEIVSTTCTSDFYLNSKIINIAKNKKQKKAKQNW